MLTSGEPFPVPGSQATPGIESGAQSTFARSPEIDGVPGRPA
ncbi:MAG TPA: hypothetical protein VG164_08455 [Trebonia sp.]|nr:hypothetical protein [Trebonia sp.]